MADAPELAKPGAGLPFLQWLLARFYLFPKFCRNSSWERAMEFHAREGAKVLERARSLSAEQLQQRVLVSGVRGIEDSSRFWSVAMAVEHLMIVGDQMIRAITSLSAGKVPDGKADIAAVKPKGVHADRTAIPAYEEFLARYRKAYEGLPSLDSTAKFYHPWFGKMTAYQWHCLAASHTYIHRKQIDAIISGLSSTRRSA